VTAPPGGFRPDLPPAPAQALGRNLPGVAALLVGVGALAAAITPALLFVAGPAAAVAVILGIIGVVVGVRRGRGRIAAVLGLGLGVVSLLFVAGWLLVLLTEEDFQEGFVEGFREALRDEGGVFTLQPGDCFDRPEDPRDVTRVLLVACDGPHDYEAFGVFDHPALAGEAFPGDAELVEQAVEVCERERFQAYVGRPAQSSRYLIDVIHPDASSWRLGERTVVCVLHDPTVERMEEPARRSFR
jgi:hypothetical protein